MKPALRAQIESMAGELAQVAGVAAVVLGGSHARGRARDDSDVDLGLLYREANPPDVAALQELTRRWGSTEASISRSA
jgi:predicted nucleotidyltransferase